ncbi:response regulator transcription factor [Aliishimia ponticola]|nr:response regulator [Aliishimia ponticola]
MPSLSVRRADSVYTDPSLKVLVLDDDRFDRKRIMRWARSQSEVSVEVDEAADLQQFGLALDRGKYDLILVDYCLADGDGLDALDHIISSSVNFGAYVVMVSAFEDAQIARAALDRGCDRYLLKSTLSPERWMDLVAEVGDTADGTAGRDSVSAVNYWAARGARRSLAPEADAKPEVTEVTYSTLTDAKDGEAKVVSISSALPNKAQGPNIDVLIPPSEIAEIEESVRFIEILHFIDAFHFHFDKSDH